jgi:ketosteroid isomerase-like protein
MQGRANIGRVGLAMTFALLAAACTGSSTTSSSPTTTSLEVNPSVTAATTRTTAQPTQDPIAVVDSILAYLNDGDLERVFALVAPDATWTLFGVPLALDDAVPDELAWLPPIFDLGPDATGADLVRAELELRAQLRTQRTITDCQAQGGIARCTYISADATTPIIGESEAGELTAKVEDGLVTELLLAVEPIVDATVDADAFLRWAFVTEPALDFGGPPAEYIDVLVGLIDEWHSGEQADIPVPDDVGDEPEAVVVAWLEARQSGDWDRHVALLAGDALRQEFGSRDDFEANQLLRRRIKLSECEITLENERVGAVVACIVAVEDIITSVVGSEPTNANATTFQVKNGRITSLPEFVPSLFLAEQALEQWGAAVHTAEYAAACPDGITSPFGVEERSCTQFLVDHEGEWTDAVLEPYG